MSGKTGTSRSHTFSFLGRLDLFKTNDINDATVAATTKLSHYFNKCNVIIIRLFKIMLIIGSRLPEWIRLFPCCLLFVINYKGIMRILDQIRSTEA